MTANFKTLFLVPLFASCTAINQKDAFLDALPREVPLPVPDPNLVFSDDFENGLGKWSQVSGAWTTGAPAISGVALISPAATSATPHYLTTTNNIDLTNRSNCELVYDIRFSITGTSGVGAQILHAGNVVAEFKDTSGTAAISSSSLFVTRKGRLTTGTNGKLTIWIAVPSGSVDLRIDNISVTCDRPPVSAVTVVYENLNSSGSNWTMSGWSWGAGAGYAGSAAIQMPYGGNSAGFTTSGWATFQPVQNLSNRYGCQLDFYYSVNSPGPSNCLYLEMNGNAIWSLCNATLAGNTSRLLTAFEGLSSLTFTFRGVDPDTTFGRGFGGVVDDLKLSCQQ